jgi:hypothetical protein
MMTGKPPVPRPPPDLAARGRALWRQVQEVYELDPVEEQLLLELCKVLDRINSIEAELDTSASWAVLGSAGQWRTHPLLTSLDNQVKLADRLASSLGVSMPNAAAGQHKGHGHQQKAARTRWARRARAASVTSIVGA